MRRPLGAIAEFREREVHHTDTVWLRDARIQPQRRRIALARTLHAALRARDVAEALDAVGLAQHVADLAVERQRLLVRRARRVVLPAPQRDVAEAPDAVGLAQHGADLAEERQRLLIRR